jgi:hypothetical protein
MVQFGMLAALRALNQAHRCSNPTTRPHTSTKWRRWEGGAQVVALESAPPGVKPAPAYVDAVHWTPAEGDSIEGLVLRLPQPGLHNGRRLILQSNGEERLVDASARHGHAVLADKLERLGVRVGDHVRITYVGWRVTRDGARRYRLYTLARGAGGDMAAETERQAQTVGEPAQCSEHGEGLR